VDLLKKIYDCKGPLELNSSGLFYEDGSPVYGKSIDQLFSEVEDGKLDN
jgi:hypothetical protein